MNFMNYIVGLGNADEQYEGTRHNIGRDIVRDFAKKNKFPNFEFDKKLNADVSIGKIGRNAVTLILPNTYMNTSGTPLKKVITSAKKAEKMMVVHDDLDMAKGKMKIVFARGDAGHRGVISVTRAIKTKNFPRLKVGISTATAKGKVKKPVGEEKVVKHVLGKFTNKDLEEIKKVKKQAVESLSTFVSDGYLRAMNLFN
jgi:PTH1 family peptidyl-tRNA hydrolase